MVLFGFLFFFSLAFSKQIKKVLTFKVKGMENNGSKDVSRIETGKKKERKIRVDWRKGSFTTFFMMQYARHSILTKTKPITFATVQ